MASKNNKKNALNTNSKKTKKVNKKEPKKVNNTETKTAENKIEEFLKIPETDYDELFEKKLAEQYRAFRNLKEHHLQTKKFLKILIVLLIIILLAMLLISFSS